MTCFERAPANKKRLTLIAVFVMLFASVLQSGTDSVILALAAAEIGGTEYYALAKSFSSVSAAVLMPMFAYLGAKDPSRKRSLFIWSALAGAVCIFLRAMRRIWQLLWQLAFCTVCFLPVSMSLAILSSEIFMTKRLQQSIWALSLP